MWTYHVRVTKESYRAGSSYRLYFRPTRRVASNHLNPKPSAAVLRAKFHSRRRQPGESIATFVSELKRLAEDCDFGDLNGLLRDKLVCDTGDKRIQEKLLAEAELDYEGAYRIAQAVELSDRSSRELEESRSDSHTHTGRSPQISLVNSQLNFLPVTGVAEDTTQRPVATKRHSVSTAEKKVTSREYVTARRERGSLAFLQRSTTPTTSDRTRRSKPSVRTNKMTSTRSFNSQTAVPVCLQYV